MMIELISLVFPALFSSFALERLIKKRLEFKSFLFVFVTNTLFINFFSVLFVYIFSGIEIFPLGSVNGLKTLSLLLYLFVTLIVTVIITLLERFYFYRIRIEISDETQDDTKESDDK